LTCSVFRSLHAISLLSSMKNTVIPPLSQMGKHCSYIIKIHRLKILVKYVG
jgi:hypothetical protein